MLNETNLAHCNKMYRLQSGQRSNHNELLTGYIKKFDLIKLFLFLMQMCNEKEAK